MNTTSTNNALFKLHKGYLAITVFLFIIEIMIASFMHDNIIRPYGGDFLVVILIYCFIQSFLNLPVVKLSIGVLIFAYTLEIMQYFKLVELLGLAHIQLAKTIIGIHFEWIDMLVYTLGIAAVLIIEKIRIHQK